MEEIIDKMIKDGVLEDLERARRNPQNPLEKISCDVFKANMENFKKGQVAFQENPSLYQQMNKHTQDCIKCGIKFGEFLRK